MFVNSSRQCLTKSLFFLLNEFVKITRLIFFKAVSNLVASLLTILSNEFDKTLVLNRTHKIIAYVRAPCAIWTCDARLRLVARLCRGSVRSLKSKILNLRHKCNVWFFRENFLAYRSMMLILYGCGSDLGVFGDISRAVDFPVVKNWLRHRLCNSRYLKNIIVPV